jgi:ATP phosphoribosyltransferase
LVPNNGHLYGGTIKLLKNAGFTFQKHPRRLYAVCQTYDVDLLFVRGADIPWYMAQGVGDLGITGYDLLYEQNITLGPWLNLGYSQSRLAVGVPKESPYQEMPALAGKRIATSYPNTTLRFFAEQGIAVEVITLKGALEIAPRLDVCQAFVGVVETGLSSAVNGIRLIADILTSQAILVDSPHSSWQKKEKVKRIKTVLSKAVPIEDPQIEAVV